ncbi:MAG: hypothetical protein IK061_06240 [Desulfovibrio sp.]|nr:hypothetical protein [Desulfovibrio sp.]
MMNSYTRETLEVRPVFDMELLLGLLDEKRLGGQTLEDLAEAWERWLPLLHALKLETGKGRYLALWLDPAVEDEIDEEWKKSAEYGYRLSALAQTMCQCALYQLMPEVEEAGCAPAPQPTAALREALETEGLPYQEVTHSMLPKFSVLTPYPFHGACDICHLRADCPKANGQSGQFRSFEIGGGK